MSDTRGVFGIYDIVNSKLENDWVALSDVWVSPSPVGTPNTGYFGGGGATSAVASTMDKVTYSSDTTTQVPGAALSVSRSNLAATGNSTAGYFGGGQFFPSPTPLFYSTMDKVTYSSDTTAAVPGAFLSVARQDLTATGNSTAGYFGGGFPSRSTMDKVTYSTDTTAAVPGAALSAARYALAATGNSTAGYFGGGSAGGVWSTMDKVTYSTDTRTTVPGAALSVVRRYLSATGSSTAGYFGGGQSLIGANLRSTIDKVTYSSDTTAAVPGTAFSAARYNFAATGNSTAGYFGGGGPGPFSTMDKVTYSSDTTAAVPGASLSAARYGLAASSARANALPGNFPSSAPSSPAVRFSDGVAATPNTGYFGGGNGPRSTMDKVTYSSDTTAAVPGAALSVAR